MGWISKAGVIWTALWGCPHCLLVFCLTTQPFKLFNTSLYSVLTKHYTLPINLSPWQVEEKCPPREREAMREAMLCLEERRQASGLLGRWKKGLKRPPSFHWGSFPPPRARRVNTTGSLMNASGQRLRLGICVTMAVCGGVKWGNNKALRAG